MKNSMQVNNSPIKVLDIGVPPPVDGGAVVSLAVQASLAEQDTSETNVQKNIQLAANRQEQQMRTKASLQRKSDDSELRKKVIRDAISSGDVNLLEAAVRNPVPEISNYTALERGAAEAIVAREAEDYVTVPLTDKEAQDKVRVNTRLLAISNMLDRAYDKAKTRYWEYTPREMEDVGKAMQTSIHGVVADPAADIGAAAVQASAGYIEFWKLLKDFGKGMIANTPIAASKTGLGMEAFVPGSVAKRTASYLYREDITDAQFEDQLNHIERTIDEWLGDDQFFSNPTFALEALTYLLVTGQKGNKDFDKYLKQEIIVDNEGNAYENPIKKIHDIGLTGSVTWQNIFDNPAWDMFPLVGVFRTIEAIAGTRVLAQVIRDQARAGKATSETFQHWFSFRTPGTQHPIDTSVLPEVRKLVDDAEFDLNLQIDPPRVKPSAAAISRAAAKVRKGEFPDIDFVYATYRNSEGNSYLDIHLQDSGGAPFLTEANAEAAARRRGYENFKVVPNNAGSGFHIKISRTVDESGFMDSTIGSNYNAGLLSIKSALGAGKYLWSPAVTSQWSTKSGMTSGALTASNYGKIYEKLHSPLRQLNTQEIEAVDRVLLAGAKEVNPRAEPGSAQLARGVWYSPSEFDEKFFVLNNRPPSPKERNAYYILKAGSDLNWSLMNTTTHNRLASEGWNHYKIQDLPAIGDKPIIAKVVDKRGVSSDASILLSNGSVVKRSWLPSEIITNNENILLSVYGQVSANDKQITHILHKVGKVSSDGLHRYVLGYSEGGTRNYRNVFFSKISREGKSPITLAVHASEKEGKYFVENMEKIRRIYKKYLADVASAPNPIEATRIKRNANQFIQLWNDNWSVDEVARAVKEGRFDLEGKMAVLYTGDDFPGLSQPMEDTLQMVQQNGMLWYSERGDYLTDGYGNLASLISPFEALSRQQTHAIRTAGFSNAMDREILAWSAKFGKYLDVPGVRFATPRDKFMHGHWIPTDEMSDSQRDMAQATRMHIKRVMRYADTGSLDDKLNRGSHRIGREMARILGDTKFADAVPDAVRTGKIVTESDVIQILRSTMFNMTLGFWNLGMLPLQITGSYLAMWAHPLYGVPALMEAPFIRLAAMYDMQNIFINLLDTRISKALGSKRGDFIEALMDYRRTGLFNTGNIDTRLDQLKVAEQLPGVKSTIQDVSNNMRMMTYEGERDASIIAFGIARRMAKEQVSLGKFANGSDEYIEYIRAHTSRLQGWMLAGMESYLQRNKFTALWAQMKRYPQNVREIMLGLDKDFTAKERLGLWVGSVATLGAMGVPVLGPELGEFYAEHMKNKGQPLTKEEYLLLHFGLQDLALSEIFETETAYSSRIGIGDDLRRIYSDFAEAQGVKGALAVATGLTGNNIFEASNKYAAMSQVYAALKLSSQEEVPSEIVANYAAQELSELLKSSDDYTKAYILSNYGSLLNRKGTHVVERDSGYSAMLTAFGVPSAEKVLQGKLYAISKKKKENITNLANIATGIKIDAHLALRDGNQEKFEQLLKIHNALFNFIDEDIRIDVSRESAKKLNSEGYTMRLKSLDMNYVEGRE